MQLRKRCAITAAAAAFCAALSGCGGTNADAADPPSPTPSATQSSDPYAFSRVSYLDYSDAARQTGIRPDLVAREFGFNDGIGTLCRSTPIDLTALLATLKTAAASEDNAGYGIQAMIDEVSLRIDMACPQRMSDWIAVGGDPNTRGTTGTRRSRPTRPGSTAPGPRRPGVPRRPLAPRPPRPPTTRPRAISARRASPISTRRTSATTAAKPRRSTSATATPPGAGPPARRRRRSGTGRPVRRRRSSARMLG